MTFRIQKAEEAYKKKDISLSKKAHTRKAIRKQIHGEEHGGGSGQYLGEFVYGAIDGVITTFAIVAGATGAALSPFVVVILGFANLIADGFSMACGNFLGEKAEREYIKKERRREEWEVANLPEGEKQEIKEIFRKKGFRGNDLEKAVKIVTSNKRIWVDTMMSDELGLIESSKSPWKTASMTFFGFLTIGVIPLSAYVLAFFISSFQKNTFVIASILTFVALVLIGMIKRHVTKSNMLRAVAETIFIGGAAAVIAYAIGFFLRWLVTS